MTRGAVAVDAILARWWPTLLLGALAGGLCLANAARAPAAALVVALALLLAAVPVPALRSTALALALLVAGWWWGGARLDAQGRSHLRAETGHSGLATVVVTSPPRRTEWAVRVFGETRSYRGVPLRERVLLQLPAARSPPQGAVIELHVEVRAPR